MATETIEVPKEAFTKILCDMEVLISDVENILDRKVLQRREDVESGRVVGKSEVELDAYLKKRGVKFD